MQAAGHCRSHHLSIERRQAIASALRAATCAVEGWAWALCTTELPTSGFAAQTKEGRKIKGSDEKEAVGNDYFGMPFLLSVLLSFPEPSILLEGIVGQERFKDTGHF